MTFLEQIESYIFLSEETKTLLREGHQQGKITPEEEQEILATCEATKRELAEEELKLLVTLQEEQKQLLFETNSLEREVHQAEENFDQTLDASELADLEALI